MNYNILDLTELVRSLQRTEGYQDCFRRGRYDCDQIDCAWRALCLTGEVPEERQGRLTP